MAAALGVGPTLTSKDRSLKQADLWEVHEDSTFGGRNGMIGPAELDDLRVTKMQSVVPSDTLTPTTTTTTTTKFLEISDGSTSSPQIMTETLQDSWRDVRPDPHRRVVVP